VDASEDAGIVNFQNQLARGLGKAATAPGTFSESIRNGVLWPKKWASTQADSNTAVCTIAAVRVLVIGSVPPAAIIANMTLFQCLTTSSARNTVAVMSTRTGTIMLETRTATLRSIILLIFRVVIEFSPAPIGVPSFSPNEQHQVAVAVPAMRWSGFCVLAITVSRAGFPLASLINRFNFQRRG
jgi:hypothetical protein